MKGNCVHIQLPAVRCMRGRPFQSGKVIPQAALYSELQCILLNCFNLVSWFISYTLKPDTVSVGRIISFFLLFVLRTTIERQSSISSGKFD